MFMPRPALAGLLAFIGVAHGAEARAATTKAEAVIAAAKLATGGTAWDKPQGCFEEGTHGDGSIVYRTRFSLHGYGMRVDSARGSNNRAMGFNGKARWQTAPDGKVVATSDPASLQEAIVTNYLSANGFFFPDRFPAKVEYLRSAKDGDRQFDVIEITPDGGRALEIWFDRLTHLIQRVVDTHGSPAVRVEASDYRRVNGLTVAYKLDVHGPDGALADRGALTAFRCGDIDSAVFAPPAPQ